MSKPTLGNPGGLKKANSSSNLLEFVESDLELPSDIEQLSSDDREEAIKRKSKKEGYRKHIKDRAEKVRKRMMRLEAGEDDVSSSDSSVDEQMIEKNRDIIDEAEKLYALPLFIKPGKHQYLIKLRDSKERN